MLLMCGDDYFLLIIDTEEKIVDSEEYLEFGSNIFQF